MVRLGDSAAGAASVLGAFPARYPGSMHAHQSGDLARAAEELDDGRSRFHGCECSENHYECKSCVSKKTTDG